MIILHIFLCLEYGSTRLDGKTTVEPLKTVQSPLLIVITKKLWNALLTDNQTKEATLVTMDT